MKKNAISQWFVVVLLFSALICWASVNREASATGAGASAPVPDNNPIDLAAVKQVEQEMGKAMIAGDIEKLNQIYADDFATFGSPAGGKTITKQNLMSDFESFHDRLQWFENGPMDVQVFGNLALAQGSVKEKRSRNGKDTSGEFAWMDLLERRAGKWVVVRSAGARLV